MAIGKLLSGGIFEQGDLGHIEEIESVFEKYKIEAVFHFAAYAYVGESVTEPEKYYDNNVANTLNLLKVMRRHGCSKIIFLLPVPLMGNRKAYRSRKTCRRIR